MSSPPSSGKSTPSSALASAGFRFATSRAVVTGAAAAAAAAVVVASTVLLGLRARRQYLAASTLKQKVKSEDVAFDHATHGEHVTFDRHSLKVNGKRILIVSGEFHYWRVPDRDRWESVLRTYKAAGLNCIRIYFHWGYHTPSEGVYHFDGNRDIDYLLTLCEKIGLYVMAAPGPYICAETQGGGHPIWLLQKKEIRLRHTVTIFHKEYDARYDRYCSEWLEHLCPILARHQITVKKDGCLIAFQVENENMEEIEGFPFGLKLPFAPADSMRFLAKRTRELGINVPLFHNDAWELSSFNGPNASFELDIYGIDKYVVFAPTLSPMKYTPDRVSGWPDWQPETVTKKVDNMETTLRSFGGTASKAPLLIAELQGGWFNQFQHDCTYDDIYNYYGENYQKIILDGMLSQGVTIMSYYMFYGGTNWGTLGDPDVYTSYDYSACIREWGFLSGRGRKLRLGMLFARSFSHALAASDPVPSKSDPATAVLHRTRTSNSVPGIRFNFMRNLEPKTRKEAEITVALEKRNVTPAKLKARLGPRTSYVTVAGVEIAKGLRVSASTLPVYCRLALGVAEGEAWIVQADEVLWGELLFDGQVTVVAGNATVRTAHDGASTVVTPTAAKGWFKIAPTASAGGPALVVVALTGDDLYKLTAAFAQGREAGEDAASVAWGALDICHDPAANTVRVEARAGDDHVYLLLPAAAPAPAGFAPVPTGDAYHGVPGLWRRSTAVAAQPGPSALAVTSKGAFGAWQTRVSDFSAFPWVPLATKTTLLGAIRPVKDTLDLQYTSGHVFYRIQFPTPTRSGAEPHFIELDVRHRCRVYLNGKYLGGHTTFSQNDDGWTAGAKTGPDPYADFKKYVLPASALRASASNDLVVVVESWGFARMAFWRNDSRNPRGILRARFSSRALAAAASWAVAGVDVRTLANVFESTGFPDEPFRAACAAASADGWAANSAAAPAKAAAALCATLTADGARPTWHRAALTLPAAGALRVPLCLRLRGGADAHVVVAGVYVARYYGNGDTPQTFFPVPESLLAAATRAGGVEVVALVYGEGSVEVELAPYEVESGAAVPHTRWSGNDAAGKTATVQFASCVEEW
ncbi:glycoside hydrolase superfamily [Zopfochytrium polystomum]|nr:glycoside hydrolase superfamily [Zopfochytrium polystomum]